MIKPFLPSTITVGSIELSLYGGLLGLGFALIIWKIERDFPEKFTLLDYLLIALSTVIGAKIAYAISSGSWQELFALSSGGLRIYGAIILGGIVTYFIAKKRGINILRLFDSVSLIVPVVQIFGRFGNFINQELYGKPCNNNLCLYVDENKRLIGYEQYETFHPIFIYEGILNLLNLGILLLLRKKLSAGAITRLFLFNYSIIRLCINRLRIDQASIHWGLDVSDITSIAIIIVVFIYSLRKIIKKVE